MPLGTVPLVSLIPRKGFVLRNKNYCIVVLYCSWADWAGVGVDLGRHLGGGGVGGDWGRRLGGVGGGGGGGV